MDNLQDVYLGHMGLLLGEPFQPPHYFFYLTIPQQFLCEKFCNEFSESTLVLVYGKGYLLNLPCLTCFLAWERIEITSAIIFRIISVIKGLKEILV